MSKNLKTLGGLLFAVSLSTSGFAATVARAVGSGMAYPTLNFAMQQNPAGLAESPSASIQGLYGFEDKNIYGSGTIGQNGFGAGFSYTRLDSTKSSQETFGVGVKLGDAMLGLTLDSTEFGNFSGDLGMTFDFSSFRLAAKVDDVFNGVSQAGFALGMDRGMWGAEIDALKSFGSNNSSDDYIFSAGLHAVVDMLSLGVGYHLGMNGGSTGQKYFWAGASIAFTHSFSVEGFYNAAGADVTVGKWSAGARFQF